MTNFYLSLVTKLRNSPAHFTHFYSTELQNMVILYAEVGLAISMSIWYKIKNGIHFEICDWTKFKFFRLGLVYLIIHT